MSSVQDDASANPQSHRPQAKATFLKKVPWSAVGAVLVAALAVLLAYCWHPAQSGRPDTATYLNAAEHIAAGHGYVAGPVAFGGNVPPPVTVFPPVFSALIGLFIVLGASPLAAAGIVQLLAYVVFALGTYWLLANASDFRLALVVTPVLLLAPGILDELDFLLSDLLGASLAVLATAALLQSRTPSRRLQSTLGVVLGLGILCRWALMFHAAAVVVAAFALWFPEAPWKARVRLLWPLVVPPLALVLAQWGRNVIVGHSPMGARPWSSTDFFAQALAAMKGIVAAASYSKATTTFALVGAAGLAVGAVLAFAFPRLRSWRAQALVITSGGYLLLMIVVASVQHFDPLLATRFWLLLPPLFAALLFALVWQLPVERHVRSAAVAVMLCVFAWSGFAAASQYTRELRRADAFHGYLDPRRQRSKAVREALRRSDAGLCHLASNVPRMLMPIAGLRPVSMLPRTNLKVENGLSARGSQCVVFFTGGGLPGSVKKWMKPHRKVIAALAKEGRAELVVKEGTELWVLRPRNVLPPNAPPNASLEAEPAGHGEGGSSQ